MKKIALILSGSGFKDGTEITEAVSAMIALGQEKAQYQCFAPDVSFDSTPHLEGSASTSRNVLEESARIARGRVQDIKSLDETQFDALLLPGGYGAALRLCDWGKKGAACQVVPEVEKTILAFYKSGKPIGGICIAPALLARVLGRHNIIVTIGDDVETIKEIEKTGAIHETCPVEEYISDREHKILTTPAYMYETEPHLVFKGVSKLVKELVEMA